MTTAGSLTRYPSPDAGETKHFNLGDAAIELSFLDRPGKLSLSINVGF
jgi:hypothetical protein